MDSEDFKTIGIAVLYATAAVFGFVGGCAVGIQQVLGGSKRAAFILAYAIIGCVGALGFFAATHVWGVLSGFQPKSFHELVLYSILVGGSISVCIFSANQTVKIIFNRLGLEVQITTRKHRQDRRHHEDEVQFKREEHHD